MITLGLDASTRIVGWAFFNGTIILDAGIIDISKMETNKEKSNLVISTLDNNPNMKSVTKINLEAALSGFMGGKTSQQTIILLARFNAVMEYIISEHWKIPVNLVGAMTARKKVFGKARIKGMTGKEYVRQELPKFHPEIHSFEKKNRNDEWDKKNEDMYDAAVISCV
jgi:hypothetical protein